MTSNIKIGKKYDQKSIFTTQLDEGYVCLFFTVHRGNHQLKMKKSRNKQKLNIAAK